MHISHQRTQQLKSTAVEELGSIYGSCRGPPGRVVLITAKATSGGSTCTSSSSRVAFGSHVRGCISKLIVASTVASQHKTYGDHGLLAIQLCLRLLQAGFDLVNNQYDTHLVVASYQEAASWIADYLGQRMVGGESDENEGSTSAGDPSRGGLPTPGSGVDDKAGGGVSAGCSGLPPACLPIQWSHLPTMMAVVRALLGSKPVAGLHGADLEHVSVLLVQAFLDSLEGADVSDMLAPRVRVVAAAGLPPASSTLLNGVVMDASVAGAAHQCVPHPGGRIAVFNVPLDIEDMKLQGGQDWSDSACRIQVEQTQSEGSWSVRREQLRGLHELVQQLADAGVKVVACQKLIHPSVIQALLCRGILPLQRVSALHVDNLATCCGALPLSALTFHPSWGKCFGQAGAIHEKDYGGRLHLVVQAPPLHAQVGRKGGRVSSLLLGAANQVTAEELKAVADSTLRSLTIALQVPHVMPGGGCSEVLLAEYVRRRAAAEPKGRWAGVQIHAFRAVAAALDAAAAGLVAVAGPEDDIAGIMLRGTCSEHPGSSSSGAVRYIGWDHHAMRLVPVAVCRDTGRGDTGRGDTAVPLESSACQVSDAWLLDLMAPKLAAVVAAVDAACTVLSTDGIVMEGSEGGEKA